jgi:aspartate/glutamate racemase
LKVLSTPPSSVLLNADESGKFSNKFDSSKNHVDSRKNDSVSVTPFGFQGTTVGIIGGMSVDATLNFLRKLVELSSQDEQKPIPFLLCSDPILNKELLSYERSLESFKLDSSQIVQSLRNKRVFLENSGARCIVMPCNVSHSWYEQVSKGCSVPFLHMADCVAKELKEAKLKPLEAGSPLRIGVLATNATLAAGFYKEKLQNEVISVLLFRFYIACDILRICLVSH